MSNLDSILKSGDNTLPTMVCLVKAMVFPVVMCGCESWTIKKSERRRIDAFELWCWGRLLKVPWTARRHNQSILKEISLEYSLGGLMLKLKLQYFGHLKQITDSCFWKDRDAGKDWRQEEKGMAEDGWMASLTQWIWVWVDSGSWWTGKPDVLQSTGLQRVRHDWATELCPYYCFLFFISICHFIILCSIFFMTYTSLLFILSAVSSLLLNLLLVTPICMCACVCMYVYIFYLQNFHLVIIFSFQFFVKIVYSVCLILYWVTEINL